MSSKVKKIKTCLLIALCTPFSILAQIFIAYKFCNCEAADLRALIFLVYFLHFGIFYFVQCISLSKRIFFSKFISSCFSNWSFLWFFIFIAFSNLIALLAIKLQSSVSFLHPTLHSLLLTSTLLFSLINQPCCLVSSLHLSFLSR